MQTIRELRSDLYDKIKENKSKIKEIKSSMQLYFDLRNSINHLENLKNNILESAHSDIQENKVYNNFIDGILHEVVCKISIAREAFRIELNNNDNSNKIDEINKLDVEISEYQEVLKQYTEFIDYQVLKEFKELHEYQGSDYVFNESVGIVQLGSSVDFDKIPDLLIS